MGAEGEKLIKTLKKKIQRNVSRKINIRVIHTTTKVSNFCSTKDKIPEEQRNNIIYKITCPGCGENYVGKTRCCFGKRMAEHGSRYDQPMYQHLVQCEQFIFMTSLYDLPVEGDHNHININAHIHESVINNSEILISSRDWLKLAFLEPFMAKKHKAKINHGSKAMKALKLF